MSISFTELQTQYGDLSGNTTSANLTRAGKLANIEHRYLLQKYFNNEASYTIATVGGTTLTLTSEPAIGDTSATLSSAWTFPTCQTVITFSDGEQRTATLTVSSTAITWSNGLVGTSLALTASLASGATSATLATAWEYDTASKLSQFTDGEQKTITYTSGSTAITWTGGLNSAVTGYVNTSVCTTSIGQGGIQTYNLPPNYSKLKTGTLTIGSLKWTPTEILSREEWDRLNVFPYYADIPSHFFIYNGKFNLWPIPSTTGNIISFNYKFRVPDLSLADYTTGTVSVSNGGMTVTGSGTSWILTTNAQSESRWIKIDVGSSKGDNLWYQVASVDSTTSLTLLAPYQGITVSGGTYTLGQMPLLMEDFQDMLIWKPLIFYFASPALGNDQASKDEYQGLYDEKLKQLAEYAGSKTINVNLSPKGLSRNPNLYQQNIG